MKRVFLLFVLTGILTLVTQGQKLREFPHGLGIEILSGHNEFNWNLEFYNISRNESFITLNGRLFYRLNVLENLFIEPSIGYTQFGGKSPTEANGYKDRLELSAIEAGGFMMYNTTFFSIELGLGLKAKYLVSATWHQYGEIDDPSNTPRDWAEEDAKNLFSDWSYNVGFRIGVPLSNYRFGIEYWKGLNDIKNEDEFSDLPVSGTIKENHYRFTFGIMF